MKCKTVFLLVIFLTALSCNKEADNTTTYLSAWFGLYQGTSHHWSSFPSDTAFITNHFWRNVSVEVQMGAIDSTIDLRIVYNDSIIDLKPDLKISANGHHFSQWGGGSSYGSLTFDFRNDSLIYHYFQKCGIPCSSGIEFNLPRVAHTK